MRDGKKIVEAGTSRFLAEKRREGFFKDDLHSFDVCMVIYAQVHAVLFKIPIFESNQSSQLEDH